MDDFTDFVGEDTSDDWRERRDMSRQVVWEELCVKKILASVGRSQVLKQVLNSGDELYGESKVTFGALERLLPDLPVRFVSTSKSDAHRDHDVAARLTRTVMYRKWMEFSELFGNERPLVLLFPWTHHGTHVLHDWAVNTEAPGSLQVRVVRRKVFVVEKLSRFLKWMGSELFHDLGE